MYCDQRHLGNRKCPSAVMILNSGTTQQMPEKHVRRVKLALMVIRPLKAQAESA